MPSNFPWFSWFPEVVETLLFIIADTNDIKECHFITLNSTEISNCRSDITNNTYFFQSDGSNPVYCTKTMQSCQKQLINCSIQCWVTIAYCVPDDLYLVSPGGVQLPGDQSIYVLHSRKNRGVLWLSYRYLCLILSVVCTFCTYKLFLQVLVRI